MQIHELNTFVGTPGAGDYLAIDNGSETAKIGANDLIPPIPDNTPIGTITMFGGSTAPTKWVLCDGRAISRTDYADLFQIIGTTYGSGNGSTTFNVPDLRDRFPVGAGSSYNLNSKGGDPTVTLSPEQIPAHTHGRKSLVGVTATQSWNSGTPTGIVSSYYKNFNLASAGTGTQMGTHNQQIDASHEHESVGGGQAHENRPPYIGINFIIYAGV